MSRTNLALIGYRATGKTNVGAALARAAGAEVIDSDAVVQREAGCTIRELFQDQGEQHFRDLEQAAVETLCAGSRTILALGGGAVLREANRLRLRESCVCVWLRAAPPEIWRRLTADDASAAQRPALTGLSEYDEIVAVLSEREPIYRETSDFHVDTDGKSIEAVAEEIRARVAADFPEVAAWL
ncbi:MAG: shikimate kinase [Planctomycetales bacterium]|nr:shikimate kinase [Planctomycetales bacterium]